MLPSSPTVSRRAARTSIAVALAALGATALPAAASAQIPGQIPIAVTCGTQTLQATSGLGGFAAWIAESGGRRVVLRPMAVEGTVYDAQGTALRSFSQALSRHDPGPTTTCAFSFAMGDGASAVTLAGTGEFLVGPQ